MSTPAPRQAPATTAAVSSLFLRSAGAPLVGGNDVRVLLDAEGNYPAWLEAIQRAQHTIHLEMYIVHNDVIGRRFRDALVERAKAHVTVRVMYDWFGALRPSSFRFWAPLVAAGAEVRVVNAPRPDTMLGLLSRNHRKLLSVDSRVAFISGLCIGDDWIGDPARGLPPWRDTGVQIEGPAVADAERAFAASWATWGAPLPGGSPEGSDQPAAGNVNVRVIPTSPDRTSLYRLELAMLGVAQKRVWLTDAYFMGTTTFIEALSAAAAHGVDVRLLLPNNSDVRWVGNASRTLYRRLLQSGVRIFEWNGTMIHAKTAVADSRIVRVGSTNLNLSSWVGNWELDVAIEDAGLAGQMEEIYERDLKNATEVVITDRRRVRLAAERPRPQLADGKPARKRMSRAMGGSANRVLKDVALAGSVLGSAVRGYRVLGPAEAASLTFFGVVALMLAAAVAWWPRGFAWPVAGVFAVMGGSLLVRAWRARFGKQ